MNSPAPPNFPDLPPYTHVPGRTPHPISHPDGHLHHAETVDETKSDQQWFDWAVYLFQHGYYWEAHEAWEQLWISLGRRGELSDAVKGMIKLAACGVKVLECNQVGATRHATRALQLLPSDRPELFGLSVAKAIGVAQHFLANPINLPVASDGSPAVLPGFSLND